MSDTQTREDLAVAYGTKATHAIICTADPGALGSAPANEVQRKALVWTPGTVDGQVTASVTFDIPSGTATTHAATVSASTGGRIIDKVAAVYNSQPSAGQATVTFTFTQS